MLVRVMRMASAFRLLDQGLGLGLQQGAQLRQLARRQALPVAVRRGRVEGRGPLAVAAVALAVDPADALAVQLDAPGIVVEDRLGEGKHWKSPLVQMVKLEEV